MSWRTLGNRDIRKWEAEINGSRIKRFIRMIYHEFANSGLAMMGQPPVRWDD